MMLLVEVGDTLGVARVVTQLAGIQLTGSMELFMMGKELGVLGFEVTLPTDMDFSRGTCQNLFGLILEVGVSLDDTVQTFLMALKVISS